MDDFLSFLQRQNLAAKPKAVLFDLDDVLFYTNPILQRLRK